MGLEIVQKKKRPENNLRVHLAAPLCTFYVHPAKINMTMEERIYKMYLLFTNGNVPLPWYSFITDSLLKQFQTTTLQRRGILFQQKSIKVQESRIPRCAPWTTCDRAIWKEPSKVVEANQFLDCWLGTLKLQ